MVPAPFLRRALPKNSFISAIVPSVLLLGMNSLKRIKAGAQKSPRLLDALGLDVLSELCPGVRLPGRSTF